ncbi:hypothetical protein J2Y73_000433 [Peribacillus frigoritolerans]|nr:hypothetical protein [Peribacillus frigoritolerans]
MVKVLQASNNRTEAESAIKKPNIVYYMRMHENLLNSIRLPYFLFSITLPYQGLLHLMIGGVI